MYFFAHPSSSSSFRFQFCRSIWLTPNANVCVVCVRQQRERREWASEWVRLTVRWFGIFILISLALTYFLLEGFDITLLRRRTPTGYHYCCRHCLWRRRRRRRWSKTYRVAALYALLFNEWDLLLSVSLLLFYVNCFFLLSGYTLHFFLLSFSLTRASHSLRIKSSQVKSYDDSEICGCGPYTASHFNYNSIL